MTGYDQRIWEDILFRSQGVNRLRALHLLSFLWQETALSALRLLVACDKTHPTRVDTMAIMVSRVSPKHHHLQAAPRTTTARQLRQQQQPPTSIVVMTYLYPPQVAFSAFISTQCLPAKGIYRLGVILAFLLFLGIHLHLLCFLLKWICPQFQSVVQDFPLGQVLSWK